MVREEEEEQLKQRELGSSDPELEFESPEVVKCWRARGGHTDPELGSIRECCLSVEQWMSECEVRKELRSSVEEPERVSGSSVRVSRAGSLVIPGLDLEPAECAHPEPEA